jgi:hypothetical protein
MDTLWNTGLYRREDSWLPVIVDTNYRTMKTTTTYTTDLYINKHCMHVTAVIVTALHSWQCVTIKRGHFILRVMLDVLITHQVYVLQ